MFKIILWFVNILLRIIDWWNGVTVIPKKELICIKYRYRFTNYVLYLPFKIASLPYIAKCKGKIVNFNQQPGIPIYVDAEKLGYEFIYERKIED